MVQHLSTIYLSFVSNFPLRCVILDHLYFCKGCLAFPTKNLKIVLGAGSRNSPRRLSQRAWPLQTKADLLSRGGL